MNNFDFANRIITLAKSKGLSITEFGERLGLPKGTIHNYTRLKEDRPPSAPSFEFVVKILRAFEDVSADWIMLGEGSMSKSKEGNIDKGLLSESSVDYKDRYLALAERMIQVQDELVRAKHELIECLKTHRTTAKQVEAVY